MTRRTIFVFLLLLFICFNLMAVAHVAIAPDTGAYGVNMASNKYRGNEHSGINFSWIKGTGASDDDPTFDKLTGVQSKKWYLDQHIIGVGGVYDLESFQQNTSTRYEITAFCANGFYFKSQINPNIVRPFEILIVARYGQDKTDDVVSLKSSGQRAEFTWQDDKGSNSGNLWFDLVLALPLDEDPVPGSNYIKADNQTYPLVQASDYTALVTINVTAYDSTGIIGTDSISIPFSGYFDGQTEEKRDERLSLMFTPNANAGNLNIQTQNSMPIPVGNIDFMLDADYTKHETTWWQDEKYKDGYVKIFFSSRNEPDDANAQPFRFVHSSVGDSDPLTNYNSIGYEIVVSGSNSSTSFSGDDHLVNGDVENAIIPEKVTSNTSYQGAREFFEYSGTINVIIDEPTTIMQEGDYHDTVYVHVVTDPDKAGK